MGLRNNQSAPRPVLVIYLTNYICKDGTSSQCCQQTSRIPVVADKRMRCNLFLKQVTLLLFKKPPEIVDTLCVDWKWRHGKRQSPVIGWGKIKCPPPCKSLRQGAMSDSRAAGGGSESDYQANENHENATYYSSWFQDTYYSMCFSWFWRISRNDQNHEKTTYYSMSFFAILKNFKKRWKPWKNNLL